MPKKQLNKPRKEIQSSNPKDINLDDSNNETQQNYKTNKSSITISKLRENETHAVVFWTIEKKFSVISKVCIHPKPEENIVEGKEYDVSYGKSIYRAILKFKGSYEKCLEIEKSICFNNGTINSSTSQINQDSQKETSSEIEILRIENFECKKKIVELTERLEVELKKNKDALENIRDLENKIENIKLTFNKDELSRILKMCKIFQAIFENEDDHHLNIVPLSEKYPNLFVKPIVRTSITDLINNCKETQASSAFRKIIQLLLPNSTDITTKTAKQIKTTYSNLINPIFEMLNEKDPTFTVKEMNLKLNSLIQDYKKISKTKKIDFESSV